MGCQLNFDIKGWHYTLQKFVHAFEKEVKVMAFKNSQTQNHRIRSHVFLAVRVVEIINILPVLFMAEDKDAPTPYQPPNAFSPFQTPSQICCFTKLWTMVFRYALPIITVTWMASVLQLVGHENLQFMDYNKDLEERVLASYLLLSLLKSSECVSMLSSWDKELLGNLQNLSLVTWTANEQLFQY